MSADNWAVCPACRYAEEQRIVALQKQADEGYGVLSVDEFDALRAEASKPIDTGPLTTFREDYEIYGAEDGELIVSYGGECQKCKAGTTFTYKETFWAPPLSKKEGGK